MFCLSKYQASTPCAPCQGRDAGHNSSTSPTPSKVYAGDMTITAVTPHDILLNRVHVILTRDCIMCQGYQIGM